MPELPYKRLTTARRGDLIAFNHGDLWRIGVVWTAVNGFADQAHVWSADGTRSLEQVSGTRWVASARQYRSLNMAEIARAFGGRRFKTIDRAHEAVVRHVRSRLVRETA